MIDVAAALRQARAAGVASLDAQLLLAKVLGATRTGLVTGDHRRLSDQEMLRWSSWIDRRAGGEPLAYLLGEKEFRGLLLAVTPDVLVPRPDTETLVEWALELLVTLAGAEPSVLDLGTGSGAVALAVKHARPEATVTATDDSPAALAVACGNAARLGLAIECVAGSWWQPLAGRRFDLVLSNPPYIAEGDPHLDALRHEPEGALTSGVDGLDAIRRIASGAADHLRAGGWLLVEHGFDQAAEVRAVLVATGLFFVKSRRDLSGHERVSGGRIRPEPA